MSFVFQAASQLGIALRHTSTSKYFRIKWIEYKTFKTPKILHTLFDLYASRGRRRYTILLPSVGYVDWKDAVFYCIIW